MEPVHEDPAFEEWLEKVNGDLNRIGMDVREMARQPLRQWFDADLSPEDAALRAIQATEEVGELLLFDEVDELGEMAG